MGQLNLIICFHSCCWISYSLLSPRISRSISLSYHCCWNC
jgi:hypothetical protein